MGATSRTGGARADRLAIAWAIGAAVLLNFALSFENVWSTLWIRPDTRLAPELVAAWVVLLLAAWRWGRVPARLVGALAAVLTLLVVGRYADVTAPSVMGREINLYWDGGQVPRFLWVTARERGAWLLVAIAAAAVLVIVLLHRLVRAALARVARELAPRALRSPAALAVTACAVVLSLLNAAGQQWTWPYLSKPVTRSVLRQAEILRNAWSPDRLAAALPPSPRFDSDLAALRGMDVQLVFLESYGAVAFDDASIRAALAPDRETLRAAVEGSGYAVVSAFVRSPTFGGASDLAHLSLLSGIDLSDPLRHDLLLMSDRPTLLSFFREHGYETFGVYPALTWDWPEAAYYGYAHLVDGRALDYAGPAFGYWKIPDQWAMARFEAMHPLARDSPPRFTVFATMNTHAPFRPIPPYQPDRTRLLSEEPFTPAEAANAIAEGTGWQDLVPAYVRSLSYQYRWLAGHLSRPRARDAVFVLVGDHQPLGNVSGRGARWDVPVHVVAREGPVLDRLRAMGFVPGLEPAPQALGGMHQLAPWLLEAFDGGAHVRAARAPRVLALAGPRARYARCARRRRSTSASPASPIATSASEPGSGTGATPVPPSRCKEKDVKVPSTFWEIFSLPSVIPESWK